MTSLPTRLSHSADDVQRQTKRPELEANQWYQFRVGPTPKNGMWEKSGHLYVQLDCAPVNGLGESCFPTIRHNLTLPLVNPEWPGHTAPRTIGFAQAYLHAVAPERFPKFPQKGELTFAEAEERRKRLTDALLFELEARWENPEAYAHEMFYGFVKEDGQYGPKLKELSSEPPLDAPVIRDNFGG